MGNKIQTVQNQKGERIEGYYLFKCPGCDFLHAITDNTYKGKAPKWDFNGDFEKPTFNPSYLLKNQETLCHSFIKNGKIQYLNDCTHHLKGQTVDLPDIEKDDNGQEESTDN